MFRSKLSRTAMMLIVLLATSFAAHAQLFRAYLSAAGSDANPCTLAAPCRLLPAALAAVADGGEIWMLSSANYNTATVNIAKSVSILAIPGAVGSVVSTGGTDAINISTAGVKVALRNLAIVPSGTSRAGIRFVNGAELKVSDCVIADMAERGIQVQAGRVFVSDTVIRGSAGVGFRAIGGNSTLERVLLLGNGVGIDVFLVGRIAVNDSVIVGNVDGVTVATQSSAAVRFAIDKSVVADNQFGIRAAASAENAFVEVIVSRTALTHNATAAIDATRTGLGTLGVVSDQNLVAENGVGFQFNGTPVILSRGNNTLRFNGTDVAGGTLTALAGQ